MKCSLCENPIKGFGYDARPLAKRKCCEDCNKKVVHLRLVIAGLK